MRALTYLKQPFPLSPQGRRGATLLGLLATLALSAQLPAATPAGAAGSVYCVKRPGGVAPAECRVVYTTLNDASRRNYQAGDTLKLEGGATFRAPLWFDPGESGTASAPITITSYGAGQATIDARNTERGMGIDIYNAGGFEIRDLTVVGNSPAGNGVQFYNDTAAKRDYVRIDNLNVSGFRNGISIGGLSDGYNNVDVRNSNLHDNRDTGLILFGPTFNAASPNYANTQVGVFNVTAHHNDGNPNNVSFSTGNGIALGSVNHGTVRNSTAYENGRLCKTAFGPIGIWAYDSNDITIEGNESYNNRTGGKADGGGFDLDHNTSNSVIQYNYSHGNEGSGYLMYSNKANRAFTGNTIRYNISHNDGKKNTYAGIRFGGNIYNSSVHHNTVYVGPVTNGSPTAFRSNGVTGGGVTMRNNIFFMGVAGNIVRAKGVPSKLNLQGNDYYAANGSIKILWGTTTFTSLNAWRSATGQEKLNGGPVGLSVNPQLVNAGGQSAASYKLQSGSPMINAGLDFANLGTRDYFGGSVPQGSGRDVGAHEF